MSRLFATIAAVSAAALLVAAGASAHIRPGNNTLTGLTWTAVHTQDVYGSRPANNTLDSFTISARRPADSFATRPADSFASRPKDSYAGRTARIRGVAFRPASAVWGS